VEGGLEERRARCCPKDRRNESRAGMGIEGRTVNIDPRQTRTSGGRPARAKGWEDGIFFSFLNFLGVEIGFFMHHWISCYWHLIAIMPGSYVPFTNQGKITIQIITL
jgi:hypothetical protein